MIVALYVGLYGSMLVATHGVYTMSASEHNGLDNRARTMIKIENGKWVLAK